jgi:hypothetical protein
MRKKAVAARFKDASSLRADLPVDPVSRRRKLAVSLVGRLAEIEGCASLEMPRLEGLVTAL